MPLRVRGVTPGSASVPARISRPPGRRGVTFIELMVVISILTILAALAFPAMRGPHEKNKLRAAAREIVALARYARSEAVLNEAQVTLEIELKERRCRLNMDRVKEQERKKGKKPAWVTNRKNKSKRDVEMWHPMPKDIAIQTVYSWDEPDRKTDAARIVFYPDGSASDSRIVLQNRFEQQLTVTINRATALAEIATADEAHAPGGQAGGDAPPPAGQAP